jgi:hypothetical protein
MTPRGPFVHPLGAAAAVLVALAAGMLAGWTLGAPAARAGAAPPPSPAATAASPTATAAPTPSLPTPQRRVALLGDGLLDGRGLPDAQCAPVLLAKGRPDLLVLDLGLGHESSRQVVSRMHDADEQTLDEVVVWVGSYDAASGESPQQYAADMAVLLDAFHGTKVLLLAPVTPRGEPDAAPYAAALAPVAAQRGIAVADVSSLIHGGDWQGTSQDLGPDADAALAAWLAQRL